MITCDILVSSLFCICQSRASPFYGIKLGLHEMILLQGQNEFFFWTVFNWMCLTVTSLSEPGYIFWKGYFLGYVVYLVCYSRYQVHLWNSMLCVKHSVERFFRMSGTWWLGTLRGHCWFRAQFPLYYLAIWESQYLEMLKKINSHHLN